MNNIITEVISAPTSFVPICSLGLRDAGLESSELIIGIDFTKSNIYNGTESFNAKSLHYMNEAVSLWYFYSVMLCYVMLTYQAIR